MFKAIKEMFSLFVNEPGLIEQVDKLKQERQERIARGEEEPEEPARFHPSTHRVQPQSVASYGGASATVFGGGGCDGGGVC